jgi:hypothetical protein
MFNHFESSPGNQKLRTPWHPSWRDKGDRPSIEHQGGVMSTRGGEIMRRLNSIDEQKLILHYDDEQGR